MFSIGEFSKITGLTVKTLRFYHECGVLVPARVEGTSRYRYYDDRNVETARAIAALRQYDFSLEEIAEILRDHGDEADILTFLERRKKTLSERVARDRDLINSIDSIIHRERKAQQMNQQTAFEIEEKTIPSVLVAGVRMRGRYDECGQGFAKIGRNFGRHISGKCLCLYYDGEYKEDDADFEPCMPVRKAMPVEGFNVRELPGGKCVTLVHRGPYSEIGRSYEKVLRYIKQRGYEMLLPTREVYLKGPGMIFKGNPKKYLTEIQVLVAET
jgi:DNA-binding transcriptional MerR regulator/DNA gyrase inhibitor GyrI